jgi:hypothetical protein
MSRERSARYYLDAEADGRCHYSRNRAHPIHNLDRGAHILILACGKAAQERAGYPCRDGGELDRRQMRELGATEAELRNAAVRAKEMVSKYWPFVEELAHRLNSSNEGAIYGASIDQIWMGRGINGNPGRAIRPIATDEEDDSGLETEASKSGRVKSKKAKADDEDALENPTPSEGLIAGSPPGPKSRWARGLPTAARKVDPVFSVAGFNVLLPELWQLKPRRHREGKMTSRQVVNSTFAAVGMAAMSLAVPAPATAQPTAVQIDKDDIGGVVTGPSSAAKASRHVFPAGSRTRVIANAAIRPVLG